jgi:hypothetical protein
MPGYLLLIWLIWLIWQNRIYLTAIAAARPRTPPRPEKRVRGGLVSAPPPKKPSPFRHRHQYIANLGSDNGVFTFLPIEPRPLRDMHTRYGPLPVLLIKRSPWIWFTRRRGGWVPSSVIVDCFFLGGTAVVVESYIPAV